MKKKSLLITVLALVLALLLAACGSSGGETTPPGTQAGGDTPSSEKTVSGVEIESAPAKVDYYVDEVFDPAGGTLTVTYTDGTTESVPFTAEGVEIGEVNTSRAGTKTVTVRYGGKRTTFKVSVSVQGFLVTFNYNYEGAPEAETTNATKNSPIKRPEDPNRDGYTFYNWYIDEACTVPYDFEQSVASDMTLYAAWKSNDSIEVIYDLNYYGVAPQTYAQLVNNGEAARELGIAPARAEHAFAGWFADADATIPYEASAPVTAATTIYAGWTKTKTGESTYVFEAEETDLANKVGPGYSGEAVGSGMIVQDTTGTASGGKAVAYLYKRGLSLEFYIASSEDVENATLVISMAQEFNGITITDETYQVRVYHAEGEDFTNVEYGSVSLEDGNYGDHLTVQISLKKGFNMIQLYTNNGVNPMGEGTGTFAGTAPMIDCIKITTSAVLTWDENHGLPMKY